MMIGGDINFLVVKFDQLIVYYFDKFCVVLNGNK